MKCLDVRGREGTLLSSYEKMQLYNGPPDAVASGPHEREKYRSMEVIERVSWLSMEMSPLYNGS